MNPTPATEQWYIAHPRSDLMTLPLEVLISLAQVGESVLLGAPVEVLAPQCERTRRQLDAATAGDTNG